MGNLGREGLQGEGQQDSSAVAVALEPARELPKLSDPVARMGGD